MHDIQKLVSKLFDLQIDRYPEGFFDLLSYISDSPHQVLLRFHGERPPVVIWSSEETKSIEGDLSWYTRGLYLIDPFYLTSLESVEDWCSTIHEASLPNLQSNEYYAQLSRSFGVFDEFGYQIPVDSTNWLHLSVCTHSRFSKKVVDKLKAQLPIVSSCLKKYWDEVLVPHQSPYQSDNRKILTVGLERFGSSILTERECEAVKLFIKGYSTKEAAEALNISSQTLVVHRRNIYDKLSINSQGQLFALFFNALLCFQDEKFEDPLQIYWGQGRSSKPRHSLLN